MLFYRERLAHNVAGLMFCPNGLDVKSLEVHHLFSNRQCCTVDVFGFLMMTFVAEPFDAGLIVAVDRRRWHDVATTVGSTVGKFSKQFAQKQAFSTTEIVGSKFGFARAVGYFVLLLGTPGYCGSIEHVRISRL